MSAKDDFRESVTEMLEDASFPVTSLIGLVPHLPQGPMTKFEVGDETVSAMELANSLGESADFPYDDLESLVDDMVAAVEDAGYF